MCRKIVLFWVFALTEMLEKEEHFEMLRDPGKENED